MGGVNFTPLLFSLNNSETVKAVTLAFCTFSNFLLETFAPNLVSLTCPSLQILRRTQTGVFPISGFLVSKRKLFNENSRTSHDIDMKLRPVAKLDKRNTETSNKFDDDAMSPNYDAIAFFPIYGLFAAIMEPYSRLSLTITFYLTKTENRTKKFLAQLSYYYFE